MRLRARAPGKVNLCLFLGGSRADSRHELVTLFESVSLVDELELRVVEGALADVVRCRGVSGPNLAGRALGELRARGWVAPPVELEINKRVPVAAGMGGGSADAAATLRLAAALAPTGQIDLLELAAELGADVPSQLEPGLTLGTGAGEIVAGVAPLAAHALVIVPLGATLATGAVFAEADRLGLARPEADLEARRHELEAALVPGAVLPGELCVNDLEPAARSLCPEIAGALDALRDQGADHVFVCGSGPTCAGLWWGEGADARLAAPAQALAARFPGTTAVVPVGAQAAEVTEC